jgi:uncharacterized protein YjaZ
LGIELVNIVIWFNSDAVIHETGDGGMVVSKELCFVYINPNLNDNDLQKVITTQISATIYYELNHIVRGKFLEERSLGFNVNLPNTIISEGLASVFAQELWPMARASWTEYTKSEIDKLLEIYKQRDLDNDDMYRHDDWFYGAGDLPRWIGYKLGHYWVDNFRKVNPKKLGQI